MKHYCDGKLLAKVPSIIFYYWEQKKKLDLNNKWNIKEYHIKTMSRSSTILPFFERCSFSIYNGKKYINLNVTKKHFFSKLGEFSFSKVVCRHNKKKKKGR